MKEVKMYLTILIVLAGIALISQYLKQSFPAQKTQENPNFNYEKIISCNSTHCIIEKKMIKGE